MVAEEKSGGPMAVDHLARSSPTRTSAHDASTNARIAQERNRGVREVVFDHRPADRAEISSHPVTGQIGVPTTTAGLSALKYPGRWDSPAGSFSAECGRQGLGSASQCSK